MKKSHRQLVSVAAVISIAAGASLFLASGNHESEPGEQTIALSPVQELLRSNQQTSRYRLIPESVMTGLCWHSGEGTREGVFRDINAGIAHWRDQVPRTPPQPKPPGAHATVSVVDSGPVYVLLSRQLDQLSFEARDYSLTDSSAEISGQLVIGNRRRDLVMKVNIPAIHESHYARNIIEVNASTILAAEDLGYAVSPAGSPVNLCISMQAVKETVLPDTASDEPLTLSHYY